MSRPFQLDATQTMRVDELLFDLPVVGDALPDIRLTGISDDSRSVAAGEAFLALPGQTDQAYRQDYLLEAARAGAALIIAPFIPEPAITNQLKEYGAHCLQMDDLTERVGQLAGRVYPLVPDQMRLIAVTGTNGKSTVVDMLRQLLPDCASVGTNGVWFNQQHHSLPLTTNSLLCNHRWLHRLQSLGARTVAMEASSIGIAQGRLRDLPIDIAVLTNLTRDHLDYHGDMDEYADAKYALFRQHLLQAAVINVADHYGARLMTELQPAPVFSFRLDDPDQPASDSIEADLIAHQLQLTEQGADFELIDRYSEQSWHCHLPLWCPHNVENVLVALSIGLCINYDLSNLIDNVARLRACPGRTQTYRMYNQRLVIVDYAHTPDALDKLLSGLQAHGFDRLSLVFGCGGDRDPGKRTEMGAVAARYADRIILTNDNPRSEDPRAIIDQILEGTTPVASITEVIVDRQAAIGAALSGEDHNLVVIAGKGNETQQVNHDRVVDFTDLDAVRAWDKSLSDRANRSEIAGR